MTSHILDASALLALINKEPGADKVSACLPGVFMSAVNYAEVATVLKDIGMPDHEVETLLSTLVEHVVSFDQNQAMGSASLRPLTKDKGLSLGDRACLALAKEKNLPAVTADRAWGALDHGIQVILIR